MFPLQSAEKPILSIAVQSSEFIWTSANDSNIYCWKINSKCDGTPDSTFGIVRGRPSIQQQHALNCSTKIMTQEKGDKNIILKWDILRGKTIKIEPGIVAFKTWFDL